MPANSRARWACWRANISPLETVFKESFPTAEQLDVDLWLIRLVWASIGPTDRRLQLSIFAALVLNFASKLPAHSFPLLAQKEARATGRFLELWTSCILLAC